MNTTHLNGLTIMASDGELGKVEECYFDDESWAVRYLTVETGGWMGGRKVLISPFSVVHTDWQAKKIEVGLTKKQVENSPSINVHRPVSRQQEAQYLGYYGYPYYWEGPYLWGAAYYPTGLAVPRSPAEIAELDKIRKESSDSHLRSTSAVTGYHLEAKDGEIGHVCGFVLDDSAWSLRYVEVATQNWWPGKKVLISPDWVEKVSWPRSKVYVALTREAIRTGPEYDESTPIGRDYEAKLHAHYGRPPYWLNETETKSAPTVKVKHEAQPARNIQVNTDQQLQSDVELELRWDPSVRAEQIGVSVKNGVVELNGHVDSYFDKWSAERAAMRVHSTKALTSEIKIEMPAANRRTDSAIAEAAMHQLEWNYMVPNTVKVQVNDGCVTLKGTTEWQYQKEEAERAVRPLRGVTWFFSEIQVTPKVSAVNVKTNIENALKRSAALDSKNISVETSGGQVTLRGYVHSWAERDQARHAAWAAPGVTKVDDLITIS